MWNVIQNIFQLMLSPSCGWEDLSYQRSPSSRISDKFLSAMFFIASLAQLANAFYGRGDDIVADLLRGAIVFVSLFAGYMIARTAFGYSLGRFLASDASDKAMQVVTYGMALMSLAYAIPPLLPVSLGLSIILPLCVAVIVWKASAYLQVPKDREGMYVMLVFGSIYLPPMLIQQLFEFVIN